MNEVNYKKLENNDVKESKKKKIVTNLLGLLKRAIILAMYCGKSGNVPELP